MDISLLARTVLADRPPLFSDDFADQAARIRDELSGKCVCVIGAGGSIGRATAEALITQLPLRTLLVDLSENNLAEVTRLLRNRLPDTAPDFEAWAMDFTRPVFHALLERERPDILLNFAAFKHVRSEKDVLTLTEMLRVNVLGNLALVRWAMATGGLGRLFAISTDKAANPANCMGASKRLMEHLLFSDGKSRSPATTITSTRFANVLFSDGSLPAGFIKRIELRQPLAGPSDVLRYFITPQEAGQLCLLAACHQTTGEILVPRMRPADMLGFQTIAERLLDHLGYEPRHYGEDQQAAFANLEEDLAGRRWPCLFTPSATSGEKEFEEFQESTEQSGSNQPYADISAIVASTATAWTSLESQLDLFNSRFNDPDWLKTAHKTQVIELLESFVPSFNHLESNLNLDRVV